MTVTTVCYRSLLWHLVFACMLASLCHSFSSSPIQRITVVRALQSSSSSLIEIESLPLTEQDLQESKANLIQCCKSSPKQPGLILEQVQSLVQEVESIGEQLGIGQSSSSSGLLSGEWELLYSPEDVTRSSPFFWAFCRAFPKQSDEIFDITDSIPAPIKEVGPAYQEIDWRTTTNNENTGQFVSRVKVATLGGMATSIMTTRAAIVGVEGLDGIRLKIETTKPENSTIVKTIFGPRFGHFVNDILPPFPSGTVLEKIRPGSSEVIMRTTYCDEGLRISRNDDNPTAVYVWKRKNFATFDML